MRIRAPRHRPRYALFLAAERHARTATLAVSRPGAAQGWVDTTKREYPRSPWAQQLKIIGRGWLLARFWPEERSSPVSSSGTGATASIPAAYDQFFLLGRAFPQPSGRGPGRARRDSREDPRGGLGAAWMACGACRAASKAK